MTNHLNVLNLDPCAALLVGAGLSSRRPPLCCILYHRFAPAAMRYTKMCSYATDLHAWAASALLLGITAEAAKETKVQQQKQLGM